MRVKKHLAITLIIAVIMLTVFPTEVAFAASDYSYIKVKLSSMGSVTSVNFTVNGEYYIKENPYYTLVRGKTYTVKVSGKRCRTCGWKFKHIFRNFSNICQMRKFKLR